MLAQLCRAKDSASKEEETAFKLDDDAGSDS